MSQWTNPNGRFQVTADTISNARLQARQALAKFLEGGDATVAITTCVPHLLETSTPPGPRSSVVGYWTCTVEWVAK